MNDPNAPFPREKDMTAETNLSGRVAFMRLSDRSGAAVRALRPVIQSESPKAIEDFYSQLRASPEVGRQFADEGRLQAAKARRAAQWDNILSGSYGDEFARGSAAIGAAHAEMGVEPRWFIAGYGLILERLIKAAIENARPKGVFAGRNQGSSDDLGEALAGLVKAALLDIDLSYVAYAEAAEATRRQSETAARADLQHMAQTLSQALEGLAGGDLTTSVSATMPPEFQALKDDFNTAASKLRGMVSALSSTADGISVGSDQIAQAADDLSRRTEQQAASLEETAAALDEITATVRKTAAGAHQASEVVNAAKSDAEHSGRVVGDAVAAMSQIEKSSQQIAQIIGVIDEIAFQTNLLALNAGVEAARAGDAGRGFAVVAQEVRALAQRSAEAAKEIKALISASSAQVGSGVELVGQTGQALQRIVTKVAEIDALVSEIAASAQEQATGLAEVNTAVNQMDQVTQQNAAMVEQTTAASRSLKNETMELARLAGSFHVGDGPRRAAAPSTRAAPQRDRSAPSSRHSAPALKTMGGRGVSAARNPEPQTDDAGWEEF
jgi:methyl-accepting chemotaxis protein